MPAINERWIGGSLQRDFAVAAKGNYHEGHEGTRRKTAGDELTALVKLLIGAESEVAQPAKDVVAKRLRL